MMTMRHKLDTYGQQIQIQEMELRKSKEEARKYRQNYWDRSMFNNLVVQELMKLECSGSSFLFNCRRGRRGRRREVICRVKELLAESMSSYV